MDGRGLALSLLFSVLQQECLYVGQCPRAHLAGATTVEADRFASILPEVSQSAICLFNPFPAPQDGQITPPVQNSGNYCVQFSTAEFTASICEPFRYF